MSSNVNTVSSVSCNILRLGKLMRDILICCSRDGIKWVQVLLMQACASAAQTGQRNNRLNTMP